MAGMEERVERRRPLTRRRILRAALRVLDREGLEAVTMRRVGRELGVQAMSLYNHVQDKDDLLLGLVETVMEEFELPGPEGDWVARIGAMARGLRTLLRSHPNAIPLFTEARGPMRDPDSLAPIEVAFDTLLGAGLTPEQAVQAYRALVGYVMGYVVLEAAGFLSAHADESWPDPEDWPATIPIERFPRLVEMLPHLLTWDADAAFEDGLDVMLQGLRVRLGR
jgi:TetR/AcrR family tetracycline transcriptional repressor